MKKLLTIIALGLTLTACASEPASPPPLQPDYSALGKIYLNTQDLKVINRADRMPLKPPYIGHLFQPRLTEVVDQWVHDRLQAVGNTGHATLIIKEASVIEQPLPELTGIETWFTREQAGKYTGRIDVDIDAQSPINNATGIASAHATHAVTLPEHPTEAEKTIAYRQLLDGLMRDLNQKLDQAIHAHLAPFITTSITAGSPAVEAPSTPTMPMSILPPEVQPEVQPQDQY